MWEKEKEALVHFFLARLEKGGCRKPKGKRPRGFYKHAYSQTVFKIVLILLLFLISFISKARFFWNFIWFTSFCWRSFLVSVFLSHFWIKKRNWKEVKLDFSWGYRNAFFLNIFRTTTFQRNVLFIPFLGHSKKNCQLKYLFSIW